MTDLEILLALSIALAVANAIIQALDLHTTSEAIKRGLGTERNEVLSFMNEDYTHAGKFWELAVIKGIGAVLGAIPVGAVWCLEQLFQPGWVVAVVLAQLISVIYYVRILLSNWAIYKGGKG